MLTDPEESTEASKLKEKDSLNIWGLCKIASVVRNGIPCVCDSHGVQIGSSNLLIYLEFDDNTVWVARLPLQTASPLPFDHPAFRESMESMIATIEYVACNTTIPVPCIHAWDSSCDNLICRPYLFMENMPGQNFSFHIDNLDDVALRKIVVQWARYTMQLASLRFDKIGSLQRDENDEFTVDRLVTPYDALADKTCKYTRGPFHSVTDYLLCVSAAKKQNNLQNGGPLAYGRHIRCTLLESLMGYLVDFSFNSGPFVLHHPNFGVNHILIDPQSGTITGVLDWDRAAVLPLQSHIHVPEELNYEFMPPGELEAGGGDSTDIGWKIKFSKSFRQVFEDELNASAKRLLFSYSVDELVDRSLMFKMYEKALTSFHDERYLPALWHHVYGTDVPLDHVRRSMKAANWGLKSAQILNIEPPHGSSVALDNLYNTDGLAAPHGDEAAEKLTESGCHIFSTTDDTESLKDNDSNCTEPSSRYSHIVYEPHHDHTSEMKRRHVSATLWREL
jgi:hypothetical protein